MNQTDPVTGIAILLAAALVGGMIAHRLRQPVILGYLVIGVAVGPHALGLVSNVALIEATTTMGIALLMFTLGLETSISQLKQVCRVGLWGGIMQIISTFALGLILGVALFQWTFSQATLFGLIISLSSTAVGFKILMDQGELDSIHGRIMLAILILQDVSVVAMMIIMPLMGGALNNFPLALATAAGKALLFIGIAIISGLWILPWLMGRVGGVRSRELFLLTVLVLCLGTALGTQLFGLSMVFGAFLIGLVLRETRFAHQALAEITPLRDIFATLFFVSLGMLLSLTFMLENWPSILIIVGIILCLKLSIVYGIVRLFGYSGRVALLAGAGLFQIGEFGFILAKGGVDMGLVSEQFYSLILASAIITMLLTPLSLWLVSNLHTKFSLFLAGRGLKSKILVAPSISPPVENVNTTVVLAGYGRVGQNIAQGLRDAGIPYKVIEIDPEIVFRLRCGGEICVYGDASNTRVLSQVDLKQAKVLVVTYPDPVAVLNTAKMALMINPELKIVARVHRVREVDLLKKLGVEELVSPEYEASLEFLRRILLVSGWEKADVSRTLAAMEQEQEMIKFSPDEEA